MNLYKEFLVVENNFDDEKDINQVYDFIQAADIGSATKMAKNNMCYYVPENAVIRDTTLENTKTWKLSLISKIINDMIDKGLDDEHLWEHTKELKQIKRLFNQI